MPVKRREINRALFPKTAERAHSADDANLSGVQMRRAIAVVVGSGLLLGGAVPVAGAALGEPVPAAPATRTVTYAGYQVTVPAAWPVYRLDTDPGRCVRYDTRAVYLGTPGPDQQCPAGLIGRTELAPAARRP